jgi:hypothetical protein
MRTLLVEESNGVPLGIRAKELAHFVSSNQIVKTFSREHLNPTLISKCFGIPCIKTELCHNYWTLKERVWMVVGEAFHAVVDSYDACTPQKVLQKKKKTNKQTIFFILFIYLFIITNFLEGK